MSFNADELTFEERIKNQKSKRKKVFIIKLVSILCVFLLLTIYFVIPFSHASNVKIVGTKYYTTEQILKIAKISPKDSLYIIDGKDIKEKLDSSPLLGGNCKVNITPVGMTIIVDESYPVFSYDNGGTKYYFNDGQEIGNSLINDPSDLVGNFITSNIDKTVKLSFEPIVSNISLKNYKSLVKIIDKLSDENRNIIDHIGYSKSANEMDVYFKKGDTNDMVKFSLSLSSSLDVESGHKAISKYQVQRQIESISSSGLTPIVENGVNVYSWKIVITENEADYQIKFVPVKEGE